MRSICLILLLFCHLGFAQEPQTVVPAWDQDFLNSMGMYQFGQPLPGRFNLLIVGQDNSNNRKKINDRALLGSRADVIMVLSIDTKTAESTILSIYRGNSPGQGCRAKIGHSPSDDLINGVYRIGGRMEFIPCLEGMLEARLIKNPLFMDLLDENGQFKIHAFYEGTRTHTIKPLARDVYDVFTNNKFAFTSTYGFSAISSALDLFWSSGDIQQALTDEGQVTEQELNAASDYLIIELKERDAYKAGGYQRSFNFAMVIANVLGWVAYGIDSYKEEGYQFMGHFFGEVINNNFSSSHDFVRLEQEVFMNGDDHLFRAHCYKNAVSPIRVLQWGENENSVAIYQNGVLETYGASAYLPHLKLVPILPDPPSCE